MGWSHRTTVRPVPRERGAPRVGADNGRSAAVLRVFAQLTGAGDRVSYDVTAGGRRILWLGLSTALTERWQQISAIAELDLPRASVPVDVTATGVAGSGAVGLSRRAPRARTTAARRLGLPGRCHNRRRRAPQGVSAAAVTSGPAVQGARFVRRGGDRRSGAHAVGHRPVTDRRVRARCPVRRWCADKRGARQPPDPRAVAASDQLDPCGGGCGGPPGRRSSAVDAEARDAS